MTTPIPNPAQKAARNVQTMADQAVTLYFAGGLLSAAAILLAFVAADRFLLLIQPVVILGAALLVMGTIRSVTAKRAA